MSNPFRILDQNPQFFTTDGEVLAGGSLTFSESGTSTPANTFNGPDLGTPNSNPVVLDSSGRASTDIWGNINYRVVVKDALGAVQYTRDNVEVPGGSGTTIPTLVSGEFLTSDGTNLQWVQILQVPDPSGQNNKVLGTDGTNITWVTKPTNGSSGANAAVTVTPESTTIGNGVTGVDQFFVQSGTASAPASGTNRAQASITFPVPFKALSGTPLVMPTVSSITGGGYNGVPAITTSSTTGFTVEFDTDGGAGAPVINVPVTFGWIAFGTKAG